MITRPARHCVTRGEEKSESAQSGSFGRRFDEQVERSPLMDRLPSPLWYMSHLRSERIALCLGCVEPRTSITAGARKSTSLPARPVCTPLFVVGPSSLVPPAASSRAGFQTLFLQCPDEDVIFRPLKKVKRPLRKKERKKKQKRKKAFQAGFAAGLILNNLK